MVLVRNSFSAALDGYYYCEKKEVNNGAALPEGYLLWDMRSLDDDFAWAGGSWWCVCDIIGWFRLEPAKLWPPISMLRPPLREAAAEMVEG